MNIDGSIAFVTGANRGLAAALTEALLERGTASLYAGYADQKPPPTHDLCRSGSISPIGPPSSTSSASPPMSPW